jgi:NADPH:quinone reductase-like Zn-dependent oxidoreductase
LLRETFTTTENNMGMITTEAWVLYQGPFGVTETGQLKKEAYSFPDITDFEVLAEPIYACWEANMTHALERDPVDIARQRSEEKIVLGNAGVVRILKTGAAVTTVKEGDLCCLSPIGVWDQNGYMLKVVGYDAPRTIGLLAKRVKLHERQVVLIPQPTRHSYRQWAAFPVRYATAWSNWNVVWACWRAQMTAEDCPMPHVWGWGGGVALAELGLAKFHGCRTAMIASDDERLALIERMGIQPIDRRQFSALDYDEQKYRTDRAFKKRYLEAERTFLEIVKKYTHGQGVAIFIDNIGTPVFRATVRALSHQGVVTTAGWKKGMEISLNRASECINRHIHVHTHGCRHAQGPPAVRFAEETGWMPPVDEEVYSWESIPQLAQDYARGSINSYFPIFQVNPL